MAESFHVLLVEDEPVIRELVSAVLAGDGVTVSCAPDGPAGIRAARAAPRPDLVLLDIVLPELDGLAVCRTLKDDPATRDIPVHMLTAKAGSVYREAAARAGANGFLAKPFRPDDLEALLGRLRAARS